jgi:hypothetical protein
LAQVLSDRADDGDLAPGEPGAEHQAVVLVVLDVAAPGAEERILEGLPDPVRLQLPVALVDEAEVVDPDGRALVAAQLVWPLVRYLHAHVLEQGEHVGQGQGRARPEQLGADRALRRFEWPVEGDRDPVWREALDPLDVEEG